MLQYVTILYGNRIYSWINGKVGYISISYMEFGVHNFGDGTPTVMVNFDPQKLVERHPHRSGRDSTVQHGSALYCGVPCCRV